MRLPKPIKRVLTVVAVLVGLQCALWLAVGIWSLPRYVPGLILRDIADAELRFQANGDTPPPFEVTQYYVLCDGLAKRTTPTQLQRINAALAERSVVTLTPSQAAEVLDIEPGAAPNVDSLCYYVDWTTPLLAYVEYGQRDCALCSWGVGYRAWFVLGFWVPTGPVSSWVS